jgi:hypothetical protein
MINKNREGREASILIERLIAENLESAVLTREDYEITILSRGPKYKNDK